MAKNPNIAKLFCTATLVLYGHCGLAAGINVAPGQTLTVNASDQLTIPGPNNSYIDGTLNNYGQITINSGDTYIRGVVNNHGLIDTGPGAAFSILVGPNCGGTDRNIVNHADGTINMKGYIDMYCPDSYLENAGRLIVTERLTAGIIRGTIKNTGFMQLGGSFGGNTCENNGETKFLNEGYLEITDQTLCDFSSMGKTTFTQDSGETRVNGTFGAHEITINSGKLSGNGTIQGYFNDYPLLNGVTISPGAPLGTLTIIPAEGYLMCIGCSIDIELAAANNADQLHVNGELDLHNWKLNVVLSNGYIPAPGTQFVIASADSFFYYDRTTKYNLPTLPNGRTWKVQKTSTKLILIAN